MISPTDLSPLARLLLAYVPAPARPWQTLCWLLDQRLAAVAQRGGDPMIAAIRLAWWDSVLVEEDRAKGGGEPLVEQWRALAPSGTRAAAERLIDGWRLLVSPEDMSDAVLSEYAQARGGGLFGLIAGREIASANDPIVQAGSIWALWDLAAHVRDEALAGRALAVAQNLSVGDNGSKQWSALPRSLRLLMAVVSPDIRAGNAPRGGFRLGHYGRLLMASLRG